MIAEKNFFHEYNAAREAAVAQQKAYRELKEARGHAVHGFDVDISSWMGLSEPGVAEYASSDEENSNHDTKPLINLDTERPWIGRTEVSDTSDSDDSPTDLCEKRKKIK